MKKLTLMICLIIAISAVFAVKFDPYYFQSKTIITCFSRTAIGNDAGTIEFTKQDGVVRTGISSFDALASQYKIVDMKQMHPYVKVPEWNDKGAFLQNTTGVYLNPDDNNDAARRGLAKDPTSFSLSWKGINRSKFVTTTHAHSHYVHAASAATTPGILLRVLMRQAWDNHRLRCKMNHPD
jgi:hypothetical protein